MSQQSKREFTVFEGIVGLLMFPFILEAWFIAWFVGVLAHMATDGYKQGWSFLRKTELGEPELPRKET